MLMTKSGVLSAVFALLTGSLAAADESKAPSPAPPSEPGAVQLLKGEIDRSSQRVLTPDDPLPEGSLLIDSGTELRTLKCAGAAVEVRGDYRIVQLTDTCERVRINGNFNVVRVHATPHIEIIGSDNALTWHTVPGDETGRKSPLLINRGARNIVAPGD